jgi:hypothetical protein
VTAETADQASPEEAGFLGVRLPRIAGSSQAEAIEAKLPLTDPLERWEP